MVGEEKLRERGGDTKGLGEEPASQRRGIGDDLCGRWRQTLVLARGVEERGLGIKASFGPEYLWWLWGLTIGPLGSLASTSLILYTAEPSHSYLLHESKLF